MVPVQSLKMTQSLSGSEKHSVAALMLLLYSERLLVIKCLPAVSRWCACAFVCVGVHVCIYCMCVFGFVGDFSIHQNAVMHSLMSYFPTQCAYMWKTDGAVSVVLKLDSNESDVSIKQQDKERGWEGVIELQYCANAACTEML